MDFDEYKPTIFLDSKQLPEIKKWKVGETYDVIVTMRQTSLSEREDGTMHANFEIENIISANNEPLELEDINNLNSDADFLRESAKYRNKQK